MTRLLSKYRLPLFTFLSTAVILSIVQWKVERPMLMLERFVEGGGWAEILVIAGYAAIIAYKMLDIQRTAYWRRLTWTIFTIVFFSQLILGLFGFDRFLMTGNLHLPVPAMIIGGPIYRAQIGFMPILFLSTIILSGPAWCSQLCYFGAIDNLLAKGKTRKHAIRYKNTWKYSMLGLIVIGAIFARVIGFSNLVTTLIAAAFGLVGLVIILIISRKQGRMIHCVVWCPVGTLLNHAKFINPFRVIIESSCTECMACIPYCKYDALSGANIKARKPGLTCTWCGDCLPICNQDSISYKFFKLTPNQSRNLWIGLTITLHAVFLALARI